MWTFRKRLLNSPANFANFAVAEGGAAPAPNGADSTQMPAQTQQPSPAQTQADDIQNIWEKPTEDPNKQVAEKEPLTPEQVNAALESHVQGMNLLEGVNTEGIMEGLANSDPTNLVNALQTAQQNVVKKLIPTMIQIVDKKVQDAVNSTVEQARGATRLDLAYQTMESQMPFTQDRSTNPVARAVMKQALQKGKSEAEALATVRGFFKNVYEKGAKDLGIQTPPRTRPGGKPSGQQTAIADISESEGEEIDFEALWKGQ